MNICSSDVIEGKTVYDCVKICDGPVFPIPEVDYSVTDFVAYAEQLNASGVLQYQWTIKDGNYIVYQSGYDESNSTFDMGADYINVLTILQGNGVFYMGREFSIVLNAKGPSGKISENVVRLIVNL